MKRIKAVHYTEALVDQRILEHIRFVPNLIKSCIKNLINPPKPGLAKSIGTEEFDEIVRLIFRKSVEDYVTIMHQQYGLKTLYPGRVFSWTMNYSKYVGQRNIALTEKLGDWHYGYETIWFRGKLLEYSCEITKNPSKFFKNPENFKNFIKFCNERRDKTDLIDHISKLDGKTRRILQDRWDTGARIELKTALDRMLEKQMYENTFTRTIVDSLKRVDSRIYLEKLKKIEHIHPPEINIHDSFTLNFSDLDFNKLSFELNAIINFTIFKFNPFKFFYNNFLIHGETILFFYINHIYLMNGLGILGLILYIASVRFIDKRYKVGIGKH